MTFRRSDAGISNYKHFLSIDYVVYVEGKSDLNYWDMIFQSFAPNTAIKLEKRDGVGNTFDIEAGIVAGTIRNAILCRDTDYEALGGKIASHNNIIYTYGYSFENDFITPLSAGKLVKFLSTKPVSEKLVARAFRRYLGKLAHVGERLLMLDAACFVEGQGIVKRANPSHLLRVEASGVRMFSLPDVMRTIRGVPIDIRRRAKTLKNVESPIFPRYYCGHAMFHVFFEWCRAVSKRFSGNIPNVAIATAKNFLFSHYEQTCLPAAREYMKNCVSAI